MEFGSKTVLDELDEQHSTDGGVPFCGSTIAAIPLRKNDYPSPVQPSYY